MQSLRTVRNASQELRNSDKLSKVLEVSGRVFRLTQKLAGEFSNTVIFAKSRPSDKEKVICILE